MSLINDYLKTVGERTPSSSPPASIPPVLRKVDTNRSKGRWHPILMGGMLAIALTTAFWYGASHTDTMASLEKMQTEMRKATVFPVRAPIDEAGVSASIRRSTTPASGVTRNNEVNLQDSKKTPQKVNTTHAPHPSSKLPVSAISGTNTLLARNTFATMSAQTVQRAIEKTGAAKPAPSASAAPIVNPLSASQIVVTTRERSSTGNQPLLDINDLYQKALVAQQGGHSHQAVRYYLQVLQQKPRHLAALTNLSAVYITQGKFTAARQVLKTIREIAPQNTKALVNLGYIDLREHHYPRAKKYFKQALVINPSEESALVNLAYIATTEENHALAESYYEKIIDYHPDNIDALLNYANLMEQDSKYRRAISLYRKCLQKPGIKNDLELTARIKNRVQLLLRYASEQARQ